MSLKGEIQPNLEALEELLAAMIISLPTDSARIALWFLKVPPEFLEIESQIIGAASPFSESKSILAGDGLLIELSEQNRGKVLQLLTTTNYVYSEIIHLQIESQGTLQWAAYDHFSPVFFGDQVSQEMLENLKERQVIEAYQFVEE